MTHYQKRTLSREDNQGIAHPDVRTIKDQLNILKDLVEKVDMLNR